MKPSSDKILQDTGYLFSSSIASRIISAIAGIVTARVLGPADYGLLKIINFIPSLAKFGSFGFGSVARREIPHLRGGGYGLVAEQKVKNVSFSADLLWGGLISFIIFSVSFFYERPEIKIGLWIVSISLFIGAILRLYNIVLSVDKRFSKVAILGLISHLVSSVLILSTIYWGRIFSVLGAGLAAGMITIYYCQRKTPLGFSFAITKEEFFRQLWIALPLAGGTIAFGIFGWVQRLQVISIFSSEMLGYYMLMIFLIRLMLLFVNTLLRASSIELYERLGEGRETQESKSFILKPSLALGLFMPLVGGMAWLVSPIVFNHILPDYKPALVMLPFLIPILVFEGVSAMPRTAMNSAKLNMQSHFMGLWLIATGCFAVITYFSYQYNWGLVGIIIARTVAAFSLFCGGYFLTYKYFFKNILDMLSQVFVLLAPMIVAVGICFFLVIMIDLYSLKHIMLKVLFFLILYIPIMIIYERHLQMIIRFRKALL